MESDDVEKLKAFEDENARLEMMAAGQLHFSSKKFRCYSCPVMACLSPVDTV